MALTPLVVTVAMRDALRTGSGAALEDAVADRLLEVAAQLVARALDPNETATERPPAAVETEAIVETAAFMADRPGGPIAKEKAADVEVDYATGARTMNPVRGSGALAMLNPWRQHGAGTITAS